MWTETYRTYLEESHENPTEKVIKVVSTNFVVNTDFIKFISIVPTVINNKNYYEVRLNSETNEKIYISSSDFDRLLRPTY